MSDLIKAKRALKYKKYTVAPDGGIGIPVTVPNIIMDGYNYFHFSRKETNWLENDLISSRFSVCIESDSEIEVGDLVNVSIIDAVENPSNPTVISNFVISNNTPSIKTIDSQIYENIFKLQNDTSLYYLYTPDGFKNKYLNIRFSLKDGITAKNIIVKQESVYLEL